MPLIVFSSKARGGIACYKKLFLFALNEAANHYAVHLSKYFGKITVCFCFRSRKKLQWPSTMCIFIIGKWKQNISSRPNIVRYKLVVFKWVLYRPKEILQFGGKVVRTLVTMGTRLMAWRYLGYQPSCSMGPCVSFIIFISSYKPMWEILSKIDSFVWLDTEAVLTRRKSESF